MLKLPKTTEISKALPKKAIFDRFKPSPENRRLFDEQVNRMSIVHEISPQTTAIKEGEDVSAVYVILVTLKTAECSKKNIALLSKLIDQRMLFVLQFGDTARLAVYRADNVLISEGKPLSDWEVPLRGLDLGAVWKNIVAQIGGIDLTTGKELNAAIAENKRIEKLQKQIYALEKKVMAERQPRKKWKIAEEIERLKKELGGTEND